MRTLQATTIALLLGAVSVGCDRTTTGEPAVGTSQARVVMAASGSTGAKLHVTVTDDSTDAIVASRDVSIDAGKAVVLNLQIAPASYTFHVDVGGAGSGEAHAVLEAGATTEVRLTVGDGVAPVVSTSVDAVPQIHAMSVTMADGHATVEVDATDADGDTLTFFWSGTGIEGALQASSKLTVPVDVIEQGGVVRVVVQDSKGAAATADVALSDTIGAVASAGKDASAEACVAAQASCNAACDASAGLLDAVAKAACAAQCGLSLATCDAP